MLSRTLTYSPGDVYREQRMAQQVATMRDRVATKKAMALEQERRQEERRGVWLAGVRDRIATRNAIAAHQARR